MTIHTMNSIYTLEDRGDGAFLMTSTNKDYTGPVLVRLDQPYLFQNCFMWFLEGPKKGRTLITSRVIEINP